MNSPNPGRHWLVMCDNQLARKASPPTLAGCWRTLFDGINPDTYDDERSSGPYTLITLLHPFELRVFRFATPTNPTVSEPVSYTHLTLPTICSV